jgi:hypothetical protein
MVKLGVGRHFALGSKYPSTFFFPEDLGKFPWVQNILVPFFWRLGKIPLGTRKVNFDV